jgi:hypothetical protein
MASRARIRILGPDSDAASIPRRLDYLIRLARRSTTPRSRSGNTVYSTYAHAPWNHDRWDKRQATFDLASGAYLVTLLAHKCRVYYRVRLSVAP